MELSKPIQEAYFSALYNQQEGCNEPMKRFKAQYPDVYKIINAMYHKRVKVLKDINIMREVSFNKVYFGSLTFNELKDKNQEASKRKEVFKFLNTIFLCFLIVEEYGEDNGRYHCHYVGVFRENKRFSDIFKWHSREDIQRVKSARSVARYLCNYIVKSVPRIRRNKVLVKISRDMQVSSKYKNIGLGSLSKDYSMKAYTSLFLEDLSQ